ncbi:MAG: DUF4202 domain-containing protein [Actinomycetota bacterium]
MGDRFRFEQAIAAIDAANADDPNTIEFRGEVRPKELAHAELMTSWVQRLDPDATEAQRLAARAHHLRRWVVPRDTYPEGRAGYLRWRRDQKARHAEEVGEILLAAGYDEGTVDRVGQVIRKEGLGDDPQVQVHEDALCLVFLQTQFDPVAEQLGDDKTVDVVAKTLRKMSETAWEIALGLDLSDHGRSLVEAAVAEVEAG